MSSNIYYLIGFIFACIIAAGIFVFLYRRRTPSLTNPDFMAPIIFEALDEAIIIINTSNTIKFVNKACEKLLKVTRKEIVGKNISEIFANTRTQSIPDLNEINILTSDGQIISVSVAINKIKNHGKKFIGYNIVLKKTATRKEYITKLQEKINEIASKNNLLEEMKQSIEKEKQNIEQKVQESTHDLRQEHARLYASINNLSLGFIMTDKEKSIIMINKTIKNLFFLPFLETSIKLQELQMHTKGDIDFLESVEYALKNGSSLSFENIRVNNKYTNVFISPVILTKNNLSETIGTVILIEDKTEERIAERSREDFFTIASHELRTPLTAIKGYISLIQQLFFPSIKDEELKRIINDIDLSSSRLINIVNDFLDTSKLEQGKINVKKELCDLITITNSSIKETGSIATQKNLFIKFINSFDAATVLGDKDRIRQILINLISNSIKYTDQGEITISIEKTPDKQYKISIKDTGKGIPKENIRLLFSKFQQIDPSKGSNVVSTGLGLYISKLLVEKMNGTIKLEQTEEGKGTTFSFTLPIYEQAVAITNTTVVN